MKRYISRITGISIPWFGVSWKPTPAEADIAQRVITFLEDRRVLFNPYGWEIEDHCVQSVLQIRNFLTQVLTEFPNKEGIAQHLRAMRAACRKFLDTVGDGYGYGRSASTHMLDDPRAIWHFASALGELRGAIGLHVAIIAQKNKLGVEGDLASILPAVSDEDTP